MDRFKDQLKRQFDFLINSCKIFDNGDREEAIRIGTSIRVLLHDTKNSVSLLKHLNAKNILLFDSAPDIPDTDDNGYECFVLFTMGVLNLGKDNFGYDPNLEDFKPGSSPVLPVEQWWEKSVWKLSPECLLSRKRLVLSAANQDGGAHVDAHLNLNYEELSRYSFGTMSRTFGSQSQTIEVVNSHLVSIRTIANEILKSPDLINLLK